ncbi:hypothetical protein [Sphingorhabdus sp.]|uniref:hypothetical protein n=1 Tax=Sphingorhabdus sp. TaxID=1902408 RepID=UPI0035ADAEB1
MRKFARPCIVAIGTAQFVLPYGCAYAQNQLTVEVAGMIEQACSISVGNAFGAVNLERSGSAQATANVDCNTGFEIDARSDAGGFAANFRTPNGFDASLPYAFDFALPLENGSTMRKNCTSSEMKSRACLMGSGGAASIGQTGRLLLSWNTLGTLLAPGNYSDTITLFIAARP